MKITEIFEQKSPSLSFEGFPPKTSDNFEEVMKNAAEIAKLSPSYMSVTYGAGGAVLTEEYARKIGADFYAGDAMAAVRCANLAFASDGSY